LCFLHLLSILHFIARQHLMRPMVRFTMVSAVQMTITMTWAIKNVITVIEPSLLLYSDVSWSHSLAFIFKAKPSNTSSRTMLANCLYQESRIQYQMFKKLLARMRVKKIATRISELMMSLKAMLKAISILRRLNQTKYIIRTNLLLFSPWVTYDILFTV